jgi:hypothetical protein
MYSGVISHESFSLKIGIRYCANILFKQENCLEMRRDLFAKRNLAMGSCREL